jgi:iron complex outermembrane receptor protein
MMGISLGVGAAGASAQDAPDQNSSQQSAEQASAAQQSTVETRKSDDGVREVVVTGYRGALRSALNLKKNATVMVDAINAEDIAKFPDSNLAESLQRLPGIAVDRENGEGRSITVRGLGSDFTRVNLNGLETLTTAAASDSGSAPNRGRGFDFNIFASDLFSSLQVQKSASAANDEGSLGATVNLFTGRPLDTGNRFAVSAQDAYYENGGSHNPRIAGLVSHKFFDDRFGASVSFAYSDRDSQIDRFKRQPGISDFDYRSSSFAGNEVPARAGFAAPAGTTFGSQVTNPAALAAETGSDPAAYAALYPGAPYSTAGTFADSLVRIPSLIQIEEQNLAQKRTGFTTALQWRPTDRTVVNFDGVYSRYEQRSDVSQIQSVGLNRNNTNATYNTATAATTVANKRATYPVCTDQTALPFREAFTCGGSEAMPTGVFAGLNTTSFSTNPHNLEPYDYYNNPGSPGYPGAAAVAAGAGMYFRDTFIGRPGVDVLDAHVDANGTADYLVLRNVDWRSATDSSYFTTKFRQASLNLQQEITDTLALDLTYGKSSSLNDNQGLLVEFNRMDSPESFVYDERAHDSMPVMQLGFDPADPNNWSLVKGFSVLRNFLRETDNRYSGGHLNFDWKMTDRFGVEFGWTRRDYEFSTSEGRRVTANEAINPTLQELGVSATDLGKVYGFGTGLDVPAGTPHAFFAPDMAAFRKVIGFDCNCVNKYGDYRLSYLSNPGNQFGVDEKDNSFFVQFDWNLEVFARRLFGNVGVRYAKTDVTASGFTTAPALTGPRPLVATNEYTDTLPSLNVAYQLTNELILRGATAKVMARPLLSNLSPSITGLTTPSTQGTIGSLTIGNPKLNPFRATNYDFSVEWYFAPGALASAAYFIKDVSNYPQTVASDGTIQSLLTPDQFAGFLETQTAAQQLWLQSGNGGTSPGIYNVRQFRDSAGGKIKGYELTYQQDLAFLPGFLRHLGVQANFTHLDSSLSYILDPGSTIAPISPQIVVNGPFLGASPKAANFTVYYETQKWSARVSMAYRKDYVTTYPVAAGSCAPGLQANGTPCDSPLFNDFIGSGATRNYDASVTYALTDHFMFSLEGLNLTNQTDDRWAYAADPVVSQYSSSGRQYFIGFRWN